MTNASSQSAAAPDWGTLARPILLVGLVALAVTVGLALLWNPQAVLRPYLVGFMFWLGIGLGCLAVLMIQYVTGGAWGVAVRRVLEGATRTLPVMALLFLPVLIGLFAKSEDRLYLWSNPADPEWAGDEAMQQKMAYYLNQQFFVVRAAIYFGIWLLFTLLLNRWSRQQEQTTGEARKGFMEWLSSLSAPGILIYSLTITFAAVDWVMSIEPRWYSTIFGVLFAVSQLLSAFAFVTAFVCLLATHTSLGAIINQKRLNELGNFLLGFILVWAYISLSQFLITYAGNLPEENIWYLKRMEGGWQYIGVGLMLLHFCLPFFLLLSTDLKRNRKALGYVACFILLMRLVDLFWIIVPALPMDLMEGEIHAIGITDVMFTLLAVVAVGGVWIGAFFWTIKDRPLVAEETAAALLAGGHHV